MIYQKREPFKRGDPIVVANGRTLEMGMLWGKGGDKRETIQYFNHIRVKNIAKRIKHENHATLRYPDIVYADLKNRWSKDKITVWDKKIHRYSKENMTKNFRESFDTLLSYVSQRHKLITVFSYE